VLYQKNIEAVRSNDSSVCPGPSRRHDKLLNLAPHRRIKVHARVRYAKGLLVPWHAGEMNGPVAIAELEIADNFRLPRVFRPYWPAAAHEIPIALKEVSRSGNVGWNDLIIAANAIHLDGQHHRNIERLQFPRELDDRRASKALSVKNQARRFALVRVQFSVAVLVEDPAHEFQRHPSFPVLDCCHLHAGKVHLAQLLRQPANSGPRVVPRISAAHEAQDERVRLRDRVWLADLVQSLLDRGRRTDVMKPLPAPGTTTQQRSEEARDETVVAHGHTCSQTMIILER
jgi:hypothetical protein